MTAILLLGTTGCGGGGGNSSAGIPGGGYVVPALLIEDTAIPRLSSGEAMAPLSLRVRGVLPDQLTWHLDGGRLPAGITLDPDGVIRGTPVETGIFPFDVRAEHGSVASVASFAVAVDTFGIFVKEGLLAGDAVDGQTLRLRAIGGSGAVDFSVSGTGAFLSREPANARATFQPGSPAHAADTLVVHAVDGSGASAHLALPLRPDVRGAFRAEWGFTDVWHLDLDVRVGAHGFATDFHSCLAEAGLRAPESTDATGTCADRMAEICVRVELHREINRLFLRQTDGSAGPDGLAISFPYDEPGSGYLKPAPGTYMGGGSRRFSVMGFLDGTQSGVVGTAYVDDALNAKHENDTSNPNTGEFGVFVNRVLPYFNASYQNYVLPDTPIAHDDIPALRALLYGESVSGTRGTEIARVIRGLGRSLAVIAAHEIGHSLGLHHNRPSESGSIMNAYASIGAWTQPRFVDAHVAALRVALPGLGRGPAGQLKVGAHATLPGGGVVVCGGECCNLRLPPLQSTANRRRR